MRRLALCATALVAIGVLGAPSRGASAYPTHILPPFPAGQTWYVCQGYNGRASGTHNNIPALDLTIRSSDVGPDGCFGDTSASADKAVLAVAPGTVTPSTLIDFVCLSFDSGGSMLIGHLKQSSRVSGHVGENDQIGITAEPNTTPQQGPYAHVHIEIHATNDCSGNPIPFDNAHGTRIVGAPDMPYIGTPGQEPPGPSNRANQYRGVPLFRSVAGGSNTIVRSIQTPAIATNPDIVFLVDTTTSMTDPIQDVQSNLGTILNTVLQQQPGAEFAVAEFKDTEDPDPFTVLQNLTPNTGAIQAGINNLTPLSGGGTDAAEDWINALYQIGTGAINFRASSSRIVVLLSDSSSHDPSNGITLQQAIGKLVAEKVRVIAVAVPTPGAISDGLDSMGQASAVANGTNGELLTLAASSSASYPPRRFDIRQQDQPLGGIGDVSQAILTGLQNLPVTVGTQILDCDPYVNVAVDPTSQTVTSGDTATFNVSIAISANIPEGASVSCRIDFLIDGVIVSDPLVAPPVVVEIPVPESTETTSPSPTPSPTPTQGTPTPTPTQSPTPSPSPNPGSATFTVTKTADTADGTCDSDCSLREAIIAANAAGALSTAGVGGPPIIQLPAGTYTLTIPGTGENAALTGDLDITAAMNIVGAGPDVTIIDGGNLDTVLDVRSTGDLMLSGVTVQHGKSPGTGGIYANGPLTLTNVHVSHNKGEGTDADGATGGVTIKTIGTITDSLFFMNTATGNSTGGLYGQATSNVTVKNTTFDSNSATGNFATGGLGFNGDSILDDVTVRNNTAHGHDPLGGLFSRGTSTVMNSQFLNNDITDDTGTGAIINRGNMTIWDTTVDGNDAGDNDGVGGILSLKPNSGSASLTLRRVTVTNNTAGASGAGGLWIETPAFLGEVTIDHNIATHNATGGVEFYAADPVHLSRVAITHNSAGTSASGGMFINGGSHVTIDDSWIDHNTAVQSAVAGIDVIAGSVLDLNRVGITNNTVAGDSSTGGMSVYQATATLTNVTVSGNSAIGNATGGLYVDTGTLTVNFTTIDNNTAGNAGGVGGLTSYGTLHISNSIVGTNPGENSCWQTAGASTGHNIDQGTDCGFNLPTDKHTDPMLSSLGDSGGFSLTEAIAPNSPAKDAAGACALDSDQRVFPRPQGSACDIGAFEVGSIATTDRIWGDTLCSNGVGGDDALAGIAAFAGVTLSQPAGTLCPALSQDVYVGGWFASHLWGDFDCNGAVNLLDALHILRAAAEVPLTPADPCPQLGDTVPVS
jgi:CSLREA domain-containing protein